MAKERFLTPGRAVDWYQYSTQAAWVAKMIDAHKSKTKWLKLYNERYTNTYHLDGE